MNFCLLLPDWETYVEENMMVMQEQEVDEQVFWPRDSLFRYFELLEMLQHNLDVRTRLQSLAGKAQKNPRIPEYLYITKG